MRFVLDTSALFSMQDIPPGEAYVTPGVIAELRKYKDPRLTFWEDMLRVTSPSPQAAEAVRKAAVRTGDDARLSPTDLEVLALAMDLKAELLTDDYSIQNLARVMGIRFRGVGMKEIKEVVHWKYRCTGCRREWDENHPDCPICGSPLRSSRSRK
ncbi:MAG: nucleic acid-binding protein [Methanomassiliicoccus sp.]|nr:nucleic acid-binding protein [Methanomassiliicoccus sp.]